MQSTTTPVYSNWGSSTSPRAGNAGSSKPKVRRVRWIEKLQRADLGRLRLKSLLSSLRFSNKMNSKILTKTFKSSKSNEKKRKTSAILTSHSIRYRQMKKKSSCGLYQNKKFRLKGKMLKSSLHQAKCSVFTVQGSNNVWKLLARLKSTSTSSPNCLRSK